MRPNERHTARNHLCAPLLAVAALALAAAAEPPPRLKIAVIPKGPYVLAQVG